MSTIKVNKILSANNPVVDVADGLTVTGEVKVGSAVTSNSTGIDVTGVVTATSFKGDGSTLTGVDPSVSASSAGFLKVLNASTPQIRLSNDAGDSDDQKRAFFAIATGNNNYLTGSVANDTVLRARGGGDLLIGVGSTIRMRVDETGQVTKPAQVCFSGLNNSGSGDMNSNQTHIFKYSTSGGKNFSNVGNAHNASNGRFTAPVAGNYLCGFSNLVNGARYAYIMVNGAYIDGSTSDHVSYSGAGGYNDLTGFAIVTLAANDYVTFEHQGNGSSYGNQHGSCFFALLS